MSSWLREIKIQQYFGKNKKTEYSAETFVYYVGNGFGIPRHFARSFGLCLCEDQGKQREFNDHSGIFIVNFEHISHLVLVFLLLTLNM